MKQQILKLFILFIVMSVLTSSSDESGINRCNKAAIEEQARMEAGGDLALNLCGSRASASAEKKQDVNPDALTDELSLSPISRFILLQ
jgi:hypothetical protein